MARATLTKKSTLGAYPTLPISANAADFAFTAAGASFAQGHQFQMSGDDILLVHNANVGAQTVTILSVADPTMNRTGDITTYSVGAGEYAVFEFTSLPGWRQSDGNLYLLASATDVEFAIIHLMRR